MEHGTCSVQTECNNLRAEIQSVLAEAAQYRANLDEGKAEAIGLEEERNKAIGERDEALRDLEESEAKNGIKYTIRLERERDAARHDRNEAQTERDAAREEIVFLKKIKEGQAGMVGILGEKKDKAWQCQNEALCERNEALKEVESLSANVDRLKGNWLRFEKILKSDLDASENERDSVRNALQDNRKELSISRKATRAWKQIHDEKCKGCELLGAQRKVNEISTEKDAERVKYERTIKSLREENDAEVEKVNKLWKERDEAMFERDEATAERDKLRAANLWVNKATFGLDMAAPAGDDKPAEPKENEQHFPWSFIYCSACGAQEINNAWRCNACDADNSHSCPGIF